MEQKNNKVKEWLIKHQRILAIVCGVLFVALIVYIFLLEKEKRTLLAEVDHLNSQKEEMSAVAARDREEMQEQITLLSNQVAEQIAKDELEAEKFYPNGLPVSGKVTIVSKPENSGDTPPEELTDEELRTIVVFGAKPGAKVMAAGSGTVLSVKADSEFGYSVWIDHGNGYVTVYRYKDTPKIKEGDDVTKGQLLFEVNYASDRVGYQVLYDNEYINPMDVMEISG
ncbi:MAG: peptidoglycan DD-metalloendopeptidase family protein [Lachnospiraceae bacterium]|nr:peptidoglycan DD-metalloendopeptidase family protein [Lachnospiraceae bacterium]